MQVSTSSKKKFPFIHRDISWLAFNERVLQEANDPNVPLLMRLKFLGIFSNNLDEFFRVRVASMRRVSNLNKEAKATLGYSPKKILKAIHKRVIWQQQQFEKIYSQILEALEKHNIFIINEKELSEAQGEKVRNYFHAKVRPVLVPLMVSDIPEFPELKDGSVYLAAHLAKKDGSKQTRYTLIEIPSEKISRFLVLEGDNKETFIILLDNVIRYCLTDIFAIFGYDQCSAYTIKITKDAELDFDNDVSKSFLELMYTSIKQRVHGDTVRFIHDQEMPQDLLDFLIERMDLTEDDNIIGAGRYHNFKDFMGFPTLGPPELDNRPSPPLSNPLLDPKSHSLFKAVAQRDFLLHFPYHSYHPIIDFLREAAIDPKVKAIKITLYRVAKRSNIISALVNARKNGKKVTVVLELQARFDEAANIAWTRMLQEQGIQVLHGLQGLKIHAKLFFIEREEEEEMPPYFAHIGTGNFNEDTAKIYSDTSLFTAHKGITKEVKRIFNLIENRNRARIKPFKHLFVSPYFLVDRLESLIDFEIDQAKAGKPAYIIAKVNSLCDEHMIKKLYEASNAGVRIQLIVRGLCSLVPQIQGKSENIEAISIVDKYLEHTRFYIFGNSGKELTYLASADWMERNLYRRIEVACPIYNKELQQEIKDMLLLQLKDNTKARWQNHPEGNVYKKTNPKQNIRSQNLIYEYLSKALKIS